MKFYPSVGRSPDEKRGESYGKRTAQYYDGKFHNEMETSLMTGEAYARDTRRTPTTRIKAEQPELLSERTDEDLAFTWIGHSSFLLQYGTKNILVDPVLSERSSPVSFAGPRRFSDVPLTASQMPEVDVLLLSHDHYDHLDYDTIKSLDSKVEEYIVPLGVEIILEDWGVEPEKIHTLAWWENIEIDNITYTLTPSQHFTGRNPLKSNSTLWGGYYLDNGIHKVYYTGDGGYNGVFKKVKAQLGAPDLMLSECGQYDPSWAYVHMMPEEVAQATIDTEAKWMIPVHWGTFCICNHAWDDPIIRVTKAARENNLNIATPRIGQTVKFEDIASFNETWWEEYK